MLSLEYNYLILFYAERKDKKMGKLVKIIIGLLLMQNFIHAAELATIKAGQIGFYPNAPKIIVTNDHTNEIKLYHEGAPVKLDAKISKVAMWEPSGEKVRAIDLSYLTKPGKYYLKQASNVFNFEIKPNANKELLDGVLKSFYFQRANIDLEEKYAGKWQRKAGVADDEAYIHPSAMEADMKSRYSLDSMYKTPKGWYDAGDYGRYIINSGITMYSMLKLYEDAPELAKKLSINIPESGSSMPDLLEEIKWNLEWMLSSQDTIDGGVFTKVTSENFDGSVLPKESSKPRFQMKKSTNASLAFAGVMAMASRIYKDYDKKLADQCLKAAKNAFAWSIIHPSSIFANAETVQTGQYSSPKLGMSDEFFWAAIEMTIATKSKAYLDWVNRFLPKEEIAIPFWGDTYALGAWSALTNPKVFPKELIAKLKTMVLSQARILDKMIDESPYKVGMGMDNFVWGSNAHAANSAFFLIQAAQYTDKKEADQFYQNAIHFTDYITGRNPHGVCFITGFGEKSPMNPHHRPSQADDVKEPVPGLVIGGPHNGGQDTGQENWKCKEYRDTKHPANSWIDDDCSYATNEIAINWNAAMVYVLGMLENYYAKN